MPPGMAEAPLCPSCAKIMDKHSKLGDSHGVSACFVLAGTCNEKCNGISLDSSIHNPVRVHE